MAKFIVQTKKFELLEQNNHTKFLTSNIYLKNFSVTVNFQAGIDGITNPSSMTFDLGQKFKNLPKPKKSGYRFLGWYLDDVLVTENMFVPYGTTTLTGQWIECSESYSVNLNNEWRPVQTFTNTNSNYVVYESFSNRYSSEETYQSSTALMTIYLDGFTEFSFYINSYAESSYDYTIVGKINKTKKDLIGSYEDEGYEYVKLENAIESTQDFQYDPEGINDNNMSGWKLVTFNDLNGDENFITIIYRKDSSGDDNYDQGFIAIPTEYTQS